MELSEFALSILFSISLVSLGTSPRFWELKYYLSILLHPPKILKLLWMKMKPRIRISRSQLRKQRRIKHPIKNNQLLRYVNDLNLTGRTLRPNRMRKNPKYNLILSNKS